MIKSSLAASLALALGACATLTPPKSGAGTDTVANAPVRLKIIGINDFHGNLEPLSRPTTLVDDKGRERQLRLGGVAYLASAIEDRLAGHPDHLVISAGDLISASPLISSLFLDEPTIGAMNRIGLDFNAVGNHEFDRGWRELKRLATGGCEKLTMREPCAVEPDYSGARFGFLAANVRLPDSSTLFPAYAIRRFGEGAREVRVGVIGLTLKDTPTLVTPSGVEGLSFADEAEAINAQIPRLEAEGVDAIVVAIHQGLYTEVGYDDHSCGGVSGPLIAILKRVSPKVDLVISGHTHRAYICDFSAIDPQRDFLVTSAGYGGAFLTDITLEIDPMDGRVTAKSARNLPVRSGEDGSGEPGDAAASTIRAYRADPAIAAYVARYAEASRAESERPVGRIEGDASRPASGMQESALGNAIADAQLLATRAAGAQIALMNNSGIRSSLDPASDGTITFGQIYAVQPFGNTLVTMTLTGAELLELLEQQFDDEGFMQTFSVSQGFEFAYDLGRPVGQRVVWARLNGKAIDPQARYRVTTNSFLAAGGDKFTVFKRGRERTVGPLDLDAFESWLAEKPVRKLPPVGRITNLTRPTS